MKNFILDIVHLNSEYTGNGMYLALYFVVLLMIAFYIKEKKIKDALLFPNLLLLLGIYGAIPFFHNFVRAIYDDEIRGRFFWMLMVPAVIALGAVLLIKYLDSDKKKVIACIAILPILFFSGVFKLSSAMYEPAENLYRLPQTIIEISDEVLSQTKTPKLIVPYEIAYGFRQYSSDIKLLYGEDATYGRIFPTTSEKKNVCDEMMTSTPNLNYIGDVAAEEMVDYIVFDSVYQVFGDGQSLNSGGYTEDADFAGDRTATISENNLLDIRVVEQEDQIYWDLSEFGLKYVNTYGQYLLYQYQ